MKLLNRKNWWFWIIMLLVMQGLGNVTLALLLDCYDENAWYADWKNWLIGALFFLFPVAIMAVVFMIQMTTEAAYKLGVKGHEIYMSPYVWIMLLIIPIVGWSLFIVLLIYLYIWTLVALYKGDGEKYIK